MYPYLIFIHSIARWFLLFSLLFTIYKGIKGYFGKSVFSKTDNFLRHLTATISHIQLTIGYILYFNSPVIKYFRSHYKESITQFDYMFFGLIHIILMTISIILITIGSSVAKRQLTDRGKYKTISFYYSIALIIIFCAIPWPFSPFAQRPYLRTF